MNATSRPSGETAEPGRVVLRREAMHDALVAAVARQREDDVPARPFLADHDDVRAVGQPFRVAHLGVDAAETASSTGSRVTAPLS